MPDDNGLPPELVDITLEAKRDAADLGKNPKAKPNGRDAGDAAPYLACTSVAAWLARDVPEPDFILGEVFSTTTRALLVAETGLGKTNFGLAGAFAIAAGKGFLHWGGRGRPARVLYIDGEMSRRLLKARLRDAARRAGGVPETLHVLCRDDLADMPPLNTQEGQRFIDRLVEQIGGADFIIFDNVQALLLGDMKDEQPWQDTLPWIRDLTSRCIGQCWVHHTGHDKTRSYGTKTREWQMDLVLLLEAVERPDADIAFLAKFTKARERTPQNKPDFEPVTITLAEDRWQSEAAAVKVKPASPMGMKFYYALLDALAAPDGAGIERVAGRQTVTFERWKRECVRLGLLDGKSGDAAGKRDRGLFSKYRRELIACDQIACNGELAWTVR